ncbi:MAG: hypothetical protein FJW31_04460 [Acidobacteria bacterium]|nr:hypothetical protein [Acidobacteriota bacterium]
MARLRPAPPSYLGAIYYQGAYKGKGVLIAPTLLLTCRHVLSGAKRAGNVGHPSPVGLFPKGQTPEGLLDMAGNGWERTAEPSVRGGSFDSVARWLRAAYRFRGGPDFRDGVIGFRLVRG